MTEQGANGKAYVKERGFTREQIEHFQIGFAPDRWDALSTILKKRGYSSDLMVKASLLGKKESGEDYYDRFRNRLMFPIWDGQGKVIAFGGRTVTDEKPKYLK